MQVRIGDCGAEKVRTSSCLAFLTVSCRPVCGVVGDDDMCGSFIRTSRSRSVSFAEFGRSHGSASIGVRVHRISVLLFLEYLHVHRADHRWCDLEYRFQIHLVQSRVQMSLWRSSRDERFPCVQEEDSLFGSRRAQCDGEHDVSNCMFSVRARSARIPINSHFHVSCLRHKNITYENRITLKY